MDELRLVALRREALEAERRAFSQRHDWRKECAARRERLANLMTLLNLHESAILAALQKDLGKSHTEGYTTELALVKAEVRHAIRNLRRWMRPRRTMPGLATFPAMGRVTREPHGLVLILSPWNYPFQLVMIPLVGAIAAGNRCIVKPSSQCPETAAVLKRMVAEWLPPEVAAVVLGGHDVSDRLLEQRFDHIFFTGSPDIGRMVMRKAAAHLTPVTLELGGKSPCIVDETANVQIAARRIAFGKAVNAGQTCIAPDYVLAHASIADELVRSIADNWTSFYGRNALDSDAWPHIISQKSHDRLTNLLTGENIVSGGQSSGQRMQPTLVYPAKWESPLMQEEIFGPVLPVIPYTNLGEALNAIRRMEAPLAFYLYSGSKGAAHAVMRSLPFGGGCINDCLMHIANHHLPFGGVGNSGMGRYHGRASFECFTCQKSVLEGAFLDNPLRYPPHTPKKRGLLRMLLK